MTLTVRHSPELQEHLSTFVVDGTTVEASLFEGGRLSYPGRRELENFLSMIEPYTLELEARVIEGFPKIVESAIRYLAHWVHADSGHLGVKFDLTLELLWTAHEGWDKSGISPDRLVAALVGVQILTDADPATTDTRLLSASVALVQAMQVEGFPPSSDALEELFDGAFPASVGLCLIDTDW